MAAPGEMHKSRAIFDDCNEDHGTWANVGLPDSPTERPTLGGQMQSSTSRLLGVLAPIALGLFLAACGSSGGSSSSTGDAGSTTASAAKESTGPIVIGVANAKTGFMSAFDIPFSNGLAVAVKKFNAEGGVLGRELKTVDCDTKTEIPQGAACASEVIEKGAAVLMSSCDYDYGGPGGRVADEDGIISLSCAASPKYGKQGVGETAFSVSQGTPTEGAVMAEYAYEKLGAKNAYLLRDTGLEYSKAFCQYFTDRFEELGGNIVGSEDFENEDASIASQISNLRSASPAPEVISYCSYPPGGASGLRQIRGAGIETPIVSDTSFDGDFWLNAVPDLSEFYYPTPGSIFGDDEDPRWQQFVKEYEKETGEAPSNANYPGSGYTALELWKAAVEKAGSLETTKVLPILQEMEKQPTLNGPTTFTPDQHMALGRPMAVIQIQNGKNEFVERVTPKKVPQPQY
jgi:branched-chain amino acid transport system substrate-binding protein